MAAGKRTSRREADRRRLERAAELYLDSCYNSRSAARADEFAEYLRLARPYLSRLVRELTGIPVRSFLRSRQLAYAQQLLRTTPLPIGEVAVASAFGTEWTFIRCFKSAFGRTPAEFRREEANTRRCGGRRRLRLGSAK